MIKGLFNKCIEAIVSIMPLALVVYLLGIFNLIHFESYEWWSFTFATILLIIGITLFNLGADVSMTTMGSSIGIGITKRQNLGLLLLLTFILGLLSTIAEPDLVNFATQVSPAINSTFLIIVVGFGIGLFLILGILKVFFSIKLDKILIFLYLLVFCFVTLVLVSGKEMLIPLAFDAGGVTTGPITVPFIMALGIGVARVLDPKKAKYNSFGLIALCSIGPVIAVLLICIFIKSDITISLDYKTSPHWFIDYGYGILHSMLEVIKSLGLIVLFFIVVNYLLLKMETKRILNILLGTLITFIGLSLFLAAATTGYMAIGYKLGQELSSNITLLIIVSIILGLLVVLAEPAIHVLTTQVEKVTNGTISKLSMLISLGIAVSFALTLSIIRVIYQFSILWYLVPGYIISLGLSFFVPNIYTSIAFDSGGVASGPLTSSFILPFVIGVSASLNGSEVNSILSNAFGVVALVALAPLITIQLLGFEGIIKKRTKRKIVLKKLLQEDDEQIIVFKAGD